MNIGNNYTPMSLLDCFHVAFSLVLHFQERTKMTRDMKQKPENGFRSP